MKKISYFLILSAFLISCGKSESVQDKISEPDYSPEAITKNETSNPDTQDKKDAANHVAKKIIKTANLDINVADFEKSRASLNQILKKFDAYIESEEQKNYDYLISDDLTIRINSNQFDKLLENISGLANHISSKSINLKDVTEEFIDVQTRLENKKKVEQQYLELLKKAKTINEILQINEHIRQIREEIESKEGRLKYLSHQVNYSTIYLSMSQELESGDYPGFGNKLLKAVQGGWNGILLFILGLFYLWPFIILSGVVIWLIIRYQKKKKKTISN